MGTWSTEPTEARCAPSPIPSLSPEPGESTHLFMLADVLLKAPIKLTFSLLTKIIVYKNMRAPPPGCTQSWSCVFTSPLPDEPGAGSSSQLAPGFALARKSCLCWLPAGSVEPSGLGNPAPGCISCAPPSLLAPLPSLPARSRRGLPPWQRLLVHLRGFEPPFRSSSCPPLPNPSPRRCEAMPCCK